MTHKLSVAVHKFSSCDGCQLAFLNLGETLLSLNESIEFVHFVEAGYVNPEANCDIAFVEGSVSTPEEARRINEVRKQSKTLVTIGACATSGGIQALRNMNNASNWTKSIYASPQFISVLDQVNPIASYVKVDFEIWGCPINSEQVIAVLRAYQLGFSPADTSEKLCMECKRKQDICILITQQQPCMGPVTRAGCGAICPQFGRACYSCYGPQEATNTTSLGNRWQGFGILPIDVQKRFMQMNNNATAFKQAIDHWERTGHE